MITTLHSPVPDLFFCAVFASPSDFCEREPVIETMCPLSYSSPITNDESLFTIHCSPAPPFWYNFRRSNSPRV